MYDNGQEYYRNLGPASTILAGPQVNIDLNSSPLNPLTVTAGAYPVQWSLLSAEGTTQVNSFINTASTLTSAEIAASESNNFVTPVITNMLIWRNGLGLATGPGTELVLAATDSNSFTSRFGFGGNLGAVFGVPQQGLFDQPLTMIKGQARVGTEVNVFSDVGRAVLASNGWLSICGAPGCVLQAVPIPAAAVLFPTGLSLLAWTFRKQGRQN